MFSSKEEFIISNITYEPTAQKHLHLDSETQLCTGSGV